MTTIHIWLPAGISIISAILTIIGAMVVALLARFLIGYITG